MKVLIVSTYDVVGGAARAAIRLHDALNASGMACSMRVLAKGGDTPSIEAKRTRRELFAIRIVNRFIGNNLKKLQKSSNKNLRSFAISGSGLVDEINQSDADVVNLHWVYNEMFSVKDLARITKPVVWTFHDMWAFCGAEHYSDDDADARWRTGYSKENRDAADSGLDLDRWTWERKRKYWTKPFQLVTPSQWLADCVKESSLLGQWPVEAIPNPIDLTVYRPWPKALAREIFGLPKDAPLILFGAWGGGNLIKGADLLIKALPDIASKVPEAEAVVFGGLRSVDGQDTGGMSVHFTGSINDERALALLYSAANVMVVPSRMENLPQSAMEAQACGTPVVCFDKSGLKDAVAHGETGLRVTPYCAEELAGAVVRLLQDPELRHSMSQACPVHVARMCEPESVAARYRAVFSRAIEANQS